MLKFSRDVDRAATDDMRQNKVLIAPELLINQASPGYETAFLELAQALVYSRPQWSGRHRQQPRKLQYKLHRRLCSKSKLCYQNTLWRSLKSLAPILFQHLQAPRSGQHHIAGLLRARNSIWEHALASCVSLHNF